MVENFNGSCGVAAYCLRQSVNTVKFLFIAQKVQQKNLDPCAVKIAGKAENTGFAPEAFAVNSRANADIRHACVAAAGKADL